jgi:hypothetical protein
LSAAAQRLLTPDLEDQLHLGGGQVDVAGQQVHALDRRRPDHLVDLGVALHEQVVDGGFELVGLHAEADRERTLRVEVDEQHLAARTRRAPRRG